ncbi:MAG TPA: GNAT family N-acetyltransferase [Candidatus Limnocylindrales bacterium]|nr:GNAT family N-acetyltransferase [Candidatus Limnocylindrales bacterium]
MKVTIRKLLPKDRERLVNILEATGMFTPEEVMCALELIDIYLLHPEQKDYCIICVVDAEDQVMGYACFGPVPLTRGTYDLYWIVMDPAQQGLGLGSQLLKRVEEEISKKQARMLLIETSSQPKYTKTRNFYLKNGYVEVSRIRDFYSVGDDRVTYQKTF